MLVYLSNNNNILRVFTFCSCQPCMGVVLDERCGCHPPHLYAAARHCLASRDLLAVSRNGYYFDLLTSTNHKVSTYAVDKRETLVLVWVLMLMFLLLLLFLLFLLGCGLKKEKILFVRSAQGGCLVPSVFKVQHLYVPRMGVGRTRRHDDNLYALAFRTNVDYYWKGAADPRRRSETGTKRDRRTIP